MFFFFCVDQVCCSIDDKTVVKPTHTISCCIFAEKITAFITLVKILLFQLLQRACVHQTKWDQFAARYSVLNCVIAEPSSAKHWIDAIR